METTLVSFMNEQLELVDTTFKRYMYARLPWTARLVGLMGPRGIGKSTMVLQHIKESDEADRRKSLYVSADHSYFSMHTLNPLGKVAFPNMTSPIGDTLSDLGL